MLGSFGLLLAWTVTLVRERYERARARARVPLADL